MIPLISNIPLVERCFYRQEHPFVLKQPLHMRVRRIKEINAVIYCLIAIGIIIGIGCIVELPKPISRKGNII